MLFAGYYLDSATRLYAVRNRFFGALIGGWLTRDVTMHSADGNQYSYASGAPTRETDPYGTTSFPFNPNRPPPPTLSGAGTKWDLPSWAAPASFFFGGYVGPCKGLSWVEITGTMLQEIQGQSQVMAFEVKVREMLFRDAYIRAFGAECGKAGSFTDGGSTVVRADFLGPFAPLIYTLYRFMVYWEASCDTAGWCAPPRCYTAFTCRVF